MPRSGWLAAGAVAGALVLADVPTALRTAALVACIAGLVVATVLPRVGRGPGAAMVVGLGLVAIRLMAIPAPTLATEPPDGRGPWLMVVEGVGAPREGDQLATLRLDGPASTAIFRVSATLPRYPPVMPGDVVEVEGRLRPRPDTPFGAYLERIGAWGTLDVDRLEIATGGRAGGPSLEGLRRAAGDALTAVLPEPEAGLAAGILIGLRDRVDREVAAAFTTAGVSHVVAISGWNIAIVAAAIGALAGRLGRRRRAVVTVIAIVAYVAFAGASPSVLRAGAMAGVVLLARETGRAGRAAAALGWAAAILLIVDPGLIADAGFQLSTLATAGLIAWGSAATERFDRWTGGHAPRWLTESLGVSMAAQLATLPVVVASFGRIALISPAVNLVIGPLVAPVMAAGLVALGGGILVGAGLPSGLGALLAVPAWVGMRLMIGIIDLAAGLPGASLTVEPPWNGLLAGAIGVAILAIVLARRRPRWTRAPKGPRPTTPSATPVASPRTAPRARSPGWIRYAVLGLVVAVGCLGAVAASRPAGVARVTVLDVGQGDAILVEGSRGGRLLVDGGPDPDRLLVELDRRLPPWDRRIDVVVLSHPHEDHVAGVPLLLTRYRVGRIVENGMRGPGPSYAALRDGILDDGPPTQVVAAGDRLVIDDVRLDVRWPIRGSVPSEPPEDGSSINDASIVLLGSVGERRFLLTGDAEEGVDPLLLTQGLPRVDVLKVAHHGSRTATTTALLDVLRPRVAIVSVGTGNRYGHPTPEALDRLRAIGARTYRTDLDGAVVVTFSPSGPTVRADQRRATTGPAAAAGPSPMTGYHRLHALPSTTHPPFDAASRSGGLAGGGRRRLDGCAAAVRLGRRRPARRTPRRALRRRARHRAREPAGALGRAARPADRDDGEPPAE